MTPADAALSRALVRHLLRAARRLDADPVAKALLVSRPFHLRAAALSYRHNRRLFAIRVDVDGLAAGTCAACAACSAPFRSLASMASRNAGSGMRDADSVTKCRRPSASFAP